MLDVEPPDYYPVVDKLFADELREALASFGAEIKKMNVRVERSGRTLTLYFDMDVEREEGFPIPSLDAIVSGILDKLADDATNNFGKLYGVTFRIGGLRINQSIRKKETGTPTLIVEGPAELKPVLARVGKGLIIKMREWGYQPSTVTLSTEDGSRVSVVVKMTSKLSTYDKLTLKKAVEERARAYFKTLLGERLPVEVKILDPSDKVLKTIERGKKSVEERIQELLKRDEVRSLMDALGKGTPAP